MAGILCSICVIKCNTVCRHFSFGFFFLLHILGSVSYAEDALDKAVSLNSELESECAVAMNGGHFKRSRHRRPMSPFFCPNLKLLLSKGSVFVLGAMLVVAAGIASQYHPPDNIINGNFSECTTSNDTGDASAIVSSPGPPTTSTIKPHHTIYSSNSNTIQVLSSVFSQSLQNPLVVMATASPTAR